MTNLQPVASCVRVFQGNWENISSMKHFEINHESILSSRLGLFSANVSLVGCNVYMAGTSCGVREALTLAHWGVTWAALRVSCGSHFCAIS